MSIIEQGVEKGLIKFSEDGNFIIYIHQNKKRNYRNPEEKVQVETFLTLILIYGYSVKRILQFVSVQMGSETKEADLIVYNDDKHEETHILVECKKEDITDQQFTIAVDQAYSYAVAEGAKYVWITSKIKNQYYEVPDKKPKSRIEIPDIPQFGIYGLAPYKYVKGGYSQIESLENDTFQEPTTTAQKFFELEVVTESELTKIFIQSHQALWGGGQRNPSVAFDELDKLIFCKIWDERHPRKSGKPYDFQIFKGENPEDLLNRIKKIYAKGEKEAPEVFKDGITLSAQETLTIVKYFQRINLNKTDLDSKGKAFETFMSSYFRGDFGQYFTPRAIVKFIVDSLPITNESKVLDTSCGSGGFLLYALDKVRAQANEYYDIRKEETAHYKHWHDFAEKNLFGIEINDQIARTAKMNMIIHDDGHTNVIASDGLLSDTELQENTKNYNFKYNSFDFIITNPPFGSNIKQTEKAYLRNYNLGKKEEDWLAKTSLKHKEKDSQNTEVLFLEQCYNFLAEDGYLAVVLPDGILTNSSLQYVRNQIEDWYRIVAVVSMPQTAFKATGAGVKSSVLFLKKHKNSQTDKIVAKKDGLKLDIKTDAKYLEQIAQWEKEKKQAIKKLETEAKKQKPKADKKEINSLIKANKDKESALFTEKVNSLKEKLTETYQKQKTKQLPNYPIFMAIAEDIGYDATGRKTETNELIEINRELINFINHIEKNPEQDFI